MLRPHLFVDGLPGAAGHYDLQIAAAWWCNNHTKMVVYYGLLWFTGWWFYITILKNMRSSSMGRINYPIYEMENNPVMFQTTNQAIAILKISQHPTT
jgi:hypothetical protein